MQKITEIIKSLKPPATVRFFLFVFFLGLVYLTLFRLGFLLRHKDLAHNIPFLTYLHSFVIGARFDMVVLCYIFIPLFILSFIPFVGMEQSKISRGIIQTILFLLLGTVFFLSVVDIEFFGEFGTRLTSFTLDYLQDLAPIIYTAWKDYPIIPYLLLWGIFVFIFIWLCLKASRKVFKKKKREPLFLKSGYFILVLALFFLGARGRVKLAPIDWGLAYFSPYNFANQLSLNGIFTLGKSAFEEYSEEKGNEQTEFHFLDSEKAAANLEKILSTPKVDSVGARLPHPYNVVIIFLESWLANYVGALGGNPAVTPHFDSLARNGILLENLFATGTRTNRGLVSVLCSFPSQPGRSLMRKIVRKYPFSSIAEILKKEGYENLFIYGGDLQFDNMEGFLRQVGFEKFIGQSDFSSKEELNKWGVPDDIALERANFEFSKMKEPFLGTILTLTNHEPFVLPDTTFRIFPKNVPFSNYLNVFYYSDWALGKFFHLAKKEKYFKNTIFVLVADHGKLLDPSSDLPWERFHIAGLFYAPEILKNYPAKITPITSQTDLLPAILGILGIKTKDKFWGKDIFSLPENESGFAMFLDGKKMGFIEKDYFLIDRIGANHSLYDWRKDPQQKEDLSSQFPEIVKNLQFKERTILQVSTEEIKKSLRK